jgi:uncharacterized protein
MNIETIKWLWSASQGAAGDNSFAGRKARTRLFLATWGAPEIVSKIRQADPHSSLSALLTERPEMFGAFIWPYQNAAWTTRERWTRIISHTKIIDALGAPFTFSADKCLILLNLEDILPGFKVVLDQPKWFMREGLLVVNIFINDFRAFSLAFSFFKEEDGAIIAYIGAIQGRNREDILATYRNLTKKLFGIRPRDFLIEIFRMICQAAGVDRILAVADAYRHHRHAYFKNKTDFSTVYDEIWLDRGGLFVDQQTFELSRKISRRELTDIKPKKRSMYRKRYEFLDAVGERLQNDLPTLTPVWFADT